MSSSSISPSTSSSTTTSPSSSSSSSSSSSCRTKVKWYLQVAVAGKPNPMFLNDNLTPAPRHVLLQQLYGEQHPLVKSADSQSQSSSSSSSSTSSSCSSTASSIASSTSSTSTHLDSASSIDSDIESSPSSSCRRLLDEDETPRTQSSATTCSPTTTTTSLVGGIASETHSPFSSPSPSQCQSRSPSHFHRAVSSASDADADIPVSAASTCATLPSSLATSSSNSLSPPLGPSRCSIKLISGKTMQVSRFKAFINGNPSTSRPRQDDLMTVREDDDEDTSIVSMNSSPLVSTTSSCASTDSRLPSPLSSAFSYSSFLSSCNHLSVGATDGFGQDAWLVVCEQPALSLPSASSSSSTTRLPLSHQQSSSSSNSFPLPPSFLLGVADGVGGWRSSGVDSGVMSRHMMETAMEVLRQESLRKDKDAILFSMHYPKSLLERAYDKILEEGDVQAGSTTACFLSFVPAEHHSCPATNVITAAPLPPDQSKPQLLQSQPSSTAPPSNSNPTPSSHKLYLHTCNLGDSGFCVVRGQRVIFHSSPQRDVHHVHQLAVIPASLRAQHQDTDYEYADDKPDDALCACCELMENDVVILASDGLWDNIQPKDEIVSVPGIGLARLRYKQDAPERTLFQHQTMAQFVNDCKLHSSNDATPAASQHSTTTSNGNGTSDTSSSSHSLRDENTGDVDVEKCCEKLATYAVDYMGLQEGKPDDLTLLIAQVKLATSPEPPENTDTALSLCSSFSCSSSSSSSTCSTLSAASSSSSSSFSSPIAASVTINKNNHTENDKNSNHSMLASASSLSPTSIISVESKLS